MKTTTFYQQKLARVKKSCFANENQIGAVIKTKRFIDRHYDQELDLEYLSDIQSTSKYHLLRIFKKYYGMTPRQYLIDRRIQKAKEKLINGMTVTETCYDIGFKSLGSFSSLFKEKTGLSPSQFRKEQLSRSN